MDLFPDHATRNVSAPRTRAVLGGAVLGDAHGSAIQELNPSSWLARDPTGALLRGLVPLGGREGLSGEGSQQLLFVAEGLLRAHNAATAARADLDPVPHVHQALQRWLSTQQNPGPSPRPDGWLVGRSVLHVRRSRGRGGTLQALRSGLVGRRDRPVNNLADSTPLLRGVVAGLCPRWDPFDLGQELAAITHGSEAVHVATGAVALIVASLVGGAEWAAAMEVTRSTLVEAGAGAEVVLGAVDLALDESDRGDPSPARLSRLGDGRDPASALAIALYCTAAAEPSEIVALASLHAGATERTAALAGALGGARYGETAASEVPLELATLVDAVADDLFAHFGPASTFEPSEADWSRYPG